MKHNNIFIASLATLMLAACNNNNNTCKVEAYIDNMPEGRFYMVDKLSNAVIDSAFVANGAISFATPVDTAYVATIVDVTNVAPGGNFVINDEVTHYTFIAEPGSNLKIDLNNKLLVKGSPLNDDYIAYTEAGDALNNQIRVLNDSLVALMENNTLSPEEAENSFYSNLEVLNATYCNTLENILAAHSDNVVGAIALNSYLSACEDDARIESVMASMSQYVLTHPIASKRVQLRISLQETAEGMPFKDFSVEQEDGTTISLSDYVGKGQYVLADFWASWCPPCRQSMPLLKVLYNECHGKGLEILGLATRDKVKDSLRAIEEEEMPWPQILSDNSPAAKIYGVNGIPHLILFAPDGTIALRGYPDEEFLNKVKEMIIKQ